MKRMDPGEERLVFWLFDGVIKWLNGEQRKNPLEIVFTKLSGLWVGELKHVGEKIIIFIDNEKHAFNKDPAETLLHEVLHATLPSAKGRAINSIERLIWNRLSEKQRQTLRSFLPKKTQKRTVNNP